MIIGDRLREMREAKQLSQGDIEKRTGLLRCYISRVENGHTVPAIETLEKMARALEVPLYQLFYDGEEPPKLPNLLKRKSSDDIAWGSAGKDARFLNKASPGAGQVRRREPETHSVHGPENGASLSSRLASTCRMPHTLNDVWGICLLIWLQIRCDEEGLLDGEAPMRELTIGCSVRFSRGSRLRVFWVSSGGQKQEITILVGFPTKRSEAPGLRGF